MYSNRDRDPLFWTKDGSAVMQAQIQAACAEVDALTEQRILNTDPDTLVAYFLEKFAVEVPTLDRANVVASHHERGVTVHDHWDGRSITVPGEAFDFEVPFQGEADIFKLRPNTWDTSPPLAEVRGNSLTFTISGRSLDAGAVKSQLDQLLDSIDQYLGWHRKMWSGYVADLAREVRSHIETRRQRLLQQKEGAAKLAGLGVKLKEKPSDARTFVPPALKQKIQPQLPPMKPAVAPDPTLDQGQYETILSLIRGAGRSIEQSSSRTRELDEESLRDMFLVSLNAHFGKATGEAFNYQGKTDILIRHENENLFVAEFKIWGGDKHFLATIDQLLRYLTWRDTKAAIVVFNRNTGFSAVVSKLRELTESHSACTAGPVTLDESSFRYEFSLPQDKDRRVTVSVLAFDLGTKT